MNQEQAKKLLPVMKAFSEGRAVQYKYCLDHLWVDVPEPSFAPHLEWRIKPAKKKVTKTIADNAAPTSYWPEMERAKAFLLKKEKVCDV